MEGILTTAEPLMALAVKSVIARKDLGQTILKSLDQVYAFLNLKVIKNRGKNMVLYYDCNMTKMTVEPGVIVFEKINPEGSIICTEIPGGRVLKYLHIGPYSELFKANNSIHEYASENDISLSGLSWEIYGHWNNDESKL